MEFHARLFPHKSFWNMIPENTNDKLGGQAWDIGI